MEKKHKNRLKQKFPNTFADSQIIVLDIPDEYQYMDSELIEMLKTLVMPYFEDV